MLWEEQGFYLLVFFLWAREFQYSWLVFIVFSCFLVFNNCMKTVLFKNFSIQISENMGQVNNNHLLYVKSLYMSCVNISFLCIQLINVQLLCVLVCQVNIFTKCSRFMWLLYKSTRRNFSSVMDTSSICFFVIFCSSFPVSRTCTSFLQPANDSKKNYIFFFFLDHFSCGYKGKFWVGNLL